MASFRSKDLAVFYEKLAQLQKAGVPLAEGLQLAGMQAADPELKRAFIRLQLAVSRGSTLGQAFSQCKGVFSGLDLALIGVGEAQGRLDRTFLDLSQLWESEYRARKDFLTALVYPAALFVLALFVPNLSTWYTRGLLAYLKEVLGAASVFLLPAVALYFGYRLLAPHKRLVDKIKLSVPVVKGLVAKLAFARFSRALAALLGAGVPLGEGLKLALSAMGNRHLEERSAPALAALEQGRTLTESLLEVDVFPPDLLQRVAVGERAGQLEETLHKAAEYYDYEAQKSLKAVLKLLPVLVFLLVALRIAAVIVGFYTGYVSNLDSTIDRALHE